MGSHEKTSLDWGAEARFLRHDYACKAKAAVIEKAGKLWRDSGIGGQDRIIVIVTEIHGVESSLSEKNRSQSAPLRITTSA